MQPQSSPWRDVLVFLPPAVVSIAVAVLAGVFRRRGIVGRVRVSPGESLGPLLLILAGGFVTWIVVQVVCLAPARPTAAAPLPATASASQPARPAVAPHPSVERMAAASSVPYVLAGGFMVLANAVLRPGGLRGLGLSRGGLRRGLGAGLVGSIIAVPLIFLLAVATQLLWQALRYDHPREHDLLRFMGESASGAVRAVLIASAVLLAPFFEELLFRGHLQTLVTHALARLGGREDLARGFEVVVPGAGGEVAPLPTPPAETTARGVPSAATRWASVFLTSIVFAAVHPAWTIPPIFVLSLCLGYAYERTGSLWTVMTMHALFNATSTVIYLVMPR
jgi:membrane protease YdiL (CAAX protease family)